MAKVFINGIEAEVSDVDQYFQINEISGSDLTRIWKQINVDYASYEKWFCYHDISNIPFAFLDEIGAVLEDDSITTRLSADDYIHSEIKGVIHITEENFDDFAVYHNKCNPDMITSEQIKRNLSEWGIFALLSDNQITAYTLIFTRYLDEAEIFCVEAPGGTSSKVLLSSAVKYAFDKGNKKILFMADKNSIAHKAALLVGFVNEGFYKGYRIQASKK